MVVQGSRDLWVAIYFLINQPEVFKGLHNMAPNNWDRTLVSKGEGGK